MVTKIKRPCVGVKVRKSFLECIRFRLALTCQRPYHAEKTWSRQLPEVKLRRVPLVPRRVTAWEYGMLLASNPF
ncbi:hypothetical protein GHT06_007581 [Daphnia sinensis]|uniref:Uncharacterized protein n=1 Tax=Daphnia sinensis TaxID=1820382 RepID=A0AAD5KUN0_9CRUS|nr:hypothetical protein GHT06_007581 [Daphnia sinensis]